MKARVLSFAIVLIALFAFNDAFAQRIHFVGTPCFNESTGEITGKVAGLGQNPDGLTVTITGSYACVNPGSRRPPAWSDLRIENIPLTSTGSGQYTFSANVYDYVSRDCPNPNWDLDFNNLRASISGTNISSSISTSCR